MGNQHLSMRETAQELRSMRDVIRWGISQFNRADLCFAQGMPEAIDEAVYLCLHALALPPDFDEAWFDCSLTMQERLDVLAHYEKRLQRVPSAYITNEAWFAGLAFYVDERVLIPRSPFAELISSGFSPWVDADSVSRVLDLCTGSGCIGIAAAMQFDDSEVVLTDVSDGALEVAERNIVTHGLEQRVKTVRSDLFQGLDGERFDLILSNPPYVSSEECARLPAEFAAEPKLGLESGSDGLDAVREILCHAREHLNDDGVLFVEVGYTMDVLQSAYPDVPFLWIDFEHGGDGVFLLTAAQLEEYQTVFDRNR